MQKIVNVEANLNRKIANVNRQPKDSNTRHTRFGDERHGRAGRCAESSRPCSQHCSMLTPDTHQLSYQAARKESAQLHLLVLSFSSPSSPQTSNMVPPTFLATATTMAVQLASMTVQNFLYGDVDEKFSSSPKHELPLV